MAFVKPLKEYSGLYCIDTDGKVYSYPRIVKKKNGVILTIKAKVLTPCVKDNGYAIVTLHKGEKQVTEYVHRLVAQTFIENPNGYPQVNHRNEVKTDNRVENLEWCTPRYNSNYGTHCQKISSAMSKRIICYGKDGIIKRYKSGTEAAREFGVSINAISQAARKGFPATCRGYYWKFE